LPCRLVGWYGHSGGVVMTQLFLADGSMRRAAIGGPDDGQRMAALPCALVAHALATSEPWRVGASPAYEFLGADPLLDALTASGFSSSSMAKTRKSLNGRSGVPRIPAPSRMQPRLLRYSRCITRAKRARSSGDAPALSRRRMTSWPSME